MRHPKGQNYSSTLEELHQYSLSLKWKMCPSCSKVGFLIGHGFLRGYSAKGPDLIVRGRRFFCSNRFRKSGCGRTFSVLSGEMIRGFVVTAQILWELLQRMGAGMSANSAWKLVAPDLSVESGHRLIRRLRQSQSRMKSYLCQIRPPPDIETNDPLLQLAAHFQNCFPLSPCPLSQFQVHFQESLLC